MLTLCILSVVLAITLLLTAWAMAVAARAAGSPRGRLWVGVRCLLLIALVNVAIAVAEFAVRPAEPTMRLEIGLLLLVVQVAGTVAVIRMSFGLSAGRAMAPFGAYLLMVVLNLGFVFAALRPFLVEGFVVPTQSMSPTIPAGGRVVVDKLLRPRRWDIVAYWCDMRGPDIYCKRLVALPGERLRFAGGQVYINDHLVPAPPVLAGRCRAAAPSYAPDGRSLGTERYADGQTITLGPDEYFFIGDNVAVSLDSRSVGPSRRTSLIGVADLIYWPLSRFVVLR